MSQTKVLISVCILLAVAYQGFAQDMEEHEKAFLKSWDTCSKKFPAITNETIQKVVEAKFEGASPELMCFVNCIGSDMGELDDAGKIMADKVMSILPPAIKADKAKQVLDGCAKAGEGKEKCATSFEQVKCVSLKIQELGKDLIDDTKTKM